MGLVDELEASIDIVELVGRYTKLKKAGTNYKALCPFPGHNEKTPSFVASPAKQIGYCFGCHRGGGPVKFIMDMENVEFREALQVLGNITGQEIPGYTENKEQIQIKKNLYNLYKDVTFYYIEALKKHPEVKKYLIDRGLTPDDISKFQFGYANSGVALYNYLRDKGYDDSLINSSQIFVNLAARKDKFISRVIFPIQNLRGDVVAFAGRIIGKGEPKYLNSPASDIYDKSSILYGLYEARNTVTKQDRIIITEGYMDTIALHRAGFFETVAVSGTALTEKHITIIKRLTHKIYLCFDNDKAGEQATRSSLEILKNKGLEVRIIVLSGSKDPDEYLEKGKDFTQLIENARSPIAYLIEKNNYDLSSIDEKKKFLEEIIEIIRSYAESIEQDMYLKELSRISDTPIAILYQMMKKKRKIKKDEEILDDEKIQLTPEDIALAYVFEYQNYFESLKNTLLFHEAFGTLLKNTFEKGLPYISSLPLEQKERLKALGLQLQEQCPSQEERDKKFEELSKSVNSYHFKSLSQKYKQDMNSGDHDALQKYSELMKIAKSHGIK